MAYSLRSCMSKLWTVPESIVLVSAFWRATFFVFIIICFRGIILWTRSSISFVVALVVFLLLMPLWYCLLKSLKKLWRLIPFLKNESIVKYTSIISKHDEMKRIAGFWVKSCFIANQTNTVTDQNSASHAFITFRILSSLMNEPHTSSWHSSPQERWTSFYVSVRLLG